VITRLSDRLRKSEVATVAGTAGTFGNPGLLSFSLMIEALVSTLRKADHQLQYLRPS
jgi:ACS family hexuronate transporter-like MFS transporter